MISVVAPLRISLAWTLASSLLLTAADWPGWRGPQRDDHSPDTGLLKTWPSGGPKRIWLSDKAGLGYAGVSIVGGKLFTMGLRNDEEHALAFDAADGKELWAASLGSPFIEKRGDGPRTTPTVDGDHLYTMSAKGTLACLQASDGKILWQKSLTADLGGKVEVWGYTESVLVTGDLVICTPGGSQGTVAALNKNTGEVAWRAKDLTDDAQYVSPILIEFGGRPQIVQLVMKKVFGLDPASGKVLWKQDWLPGAVAVIPTPIFHDGQIYISSGYKAGCKLIKLGTDNASTEVYQNKVMVNHHGGVILVGDYLYGYSDGRGWICQNFKTGEEVWFSKAVGKGAVHYADGMLYCLDEATGEVALVEASPKEWTERGRFKLEPQSKQRKSDGRVWVHPVVINGRLYLRDQELLSCYDVKA